jgi:hypothetical protein
MSEFQRMWRLKSRVHNTVGCTTGWTTQCVVFIQVCMLGKQLDRRLDEPNMFDSSNPSSNCAHPTARCVYVFTTIPPDGPTMQMNRVQPTNQ